MSSEGTPLHGDRSAYNVMDFDTEHGKDIDDSTLRRHLPLPGAAGGYARSDGTDWQRVSSIALADLADYSAGFLIVGGAADWEAMPFDWDTLSAAVGADMVHGHTSDAEGGILTLACLPDLATTYLKLDASNDPVTGDLTLTPAANSTTTLDVNQSDGTAVLDVDTTNRKIVVTSGTTGQSTIEAGLIVNNASGGGAIDDFQVNSDTLTAILVDASADTMAIGVDTVVPDGWILGIGAALERIEFHTAGHVAVMGANFGVGIAAPLAIAHLEGDTSVDITLRIRNLDTLGYEAVDFYNEAGVRVSSFAHSNTTAGALPASTWIGSRNAEKFHIVTNGVVPRVTVDIVGNVGLNGVTAPATALDIGAGVMTFAEMAAPGAGAANTGRLYCKDNGAGKTQLIIKFSDAAEHVLATMA